MTTYYNIPESAWLFRDQVGPRAEETATREILVVRLPATNIQHTLKRKVMRLEDLQDFITCYNPKNRHQRQETWHPETNRGDRLQT